MTHKKIPQKRTIPTWKLEYDLAGWLADPLTSEYDLHGHVSSEAITYSNHMQTLMERSWPLNRSMHMGDVAPPDDGQDSIYLPPGFTMLHLAAFGGKTNFVYNLMASEAAQARQLAAQMPSKVTPVPHYQWRNMPQDTTEGTPLHYAAFNTKAGTLLALTSCCKALNLPLLPRDKYRSSPLDIAIESFEPDQLLSYITTLALHGVPPQDFLPDHLIGHVAGRHGANAAKKLTLLRDDPAAFFGKFTHEAEVLQTQITCAENNFSAAYSEMEPFVAEVIQKQPTPAASRSSITRSHPDAAGWATRVSRLAATRPRNEIN